MDLITDKINIFGPQFHTVNKSNSWAPRAVACWGGVRACVYTTPNHGDKIFSVFLVFFRRKRISFFNVFLLTAAYTYFVAVVKVVRYRIICITAGRPGFNELCAASQEVI